MKYKKNSTIAGRQNSGIKNKFILQILAFLKVYVNRLLDIRKRGDIKAWER